MMHKIGLEILYSMYHMCTMALCVLYTMYMQIAKHQKATQRHYFWARFYSTANCAQMFSQKNRMTRIRHDKVLFSSKRGALLKGKKGVSARDRGSKGFFAKKKHKIDFRE